MPRFGDVTISEYTIYHGIVSGPKVVGNGVSYIETKLNLRELADVIYSCGLVLLLLSDNRIHFPPAEGRFGSA